MKVKLDREINLEEGIGRYRHHISADRLPVVFAWSYPYFESMFHYPTYVESCRLRGKTPMEKSEYIKAQWKFNREQGVRSVEYFVTFQETYSLEDSVEESIQYHKEIEVGEELSTRLIELSSKALAILKDHWNDEDIKLEFYRNECGPVIQKIAGLLLKTT